MSSMHSSEPEMPISLAFVVAAKKRRWMDLGRTGGTLGITEVQAALHIFDSMSVTVTGNSCGATGTVLDEQWTTGWGSLDASD